MQCLQNPKDVICVEMTSNLTKITLVERDIVRWAGRIQMLPGPLAWSNNCWRLWRPERCWRCWGWRVQWIQGWYQGVILWRGNKGNYRHDVGIDGAGMILGRLVGKESWQFLGRWDYRDMKSGVTQHGCCCSFSHRTAVMMKLSLGQTKQVKEAQPLHSCWSCHCSSGETGRKLDQVCCSSQ